MARKRRTQDLQEQEIKEQLDTMLELTTTQNEQESEAVEQDRQESEVLEQLELTQVTETLQEEINQSMEAPTYKLSLLDKYKELLFLVKERSIDNVNEFLEIVANEYPDYNQEEAEDVWVSIASYATNVHRLYEKVCNFYRIFVEKIVEDKQLDNKEKRIRIKNVLSGSPLAPYVMRLVNGEYQDLYRQLYYELDGDINLVLKLLGS